MSDGCEQSDLECVEVWASDEEMIVDKVAVGEGWRSRKAGDEEVLEDVGRKRCLLIDNVRVMLGYRDASDNAEA